MPDTNYNPPPGSGFAEPPYWMWCDEDEYVLVYGGIFDEHGCRNRPRFFKPENYDLLEPRPEPKEKQLDRGKFFEGFTF